MKTPILPEAMRETDGTAYADRVFLPEPPKPESDLDVLKDVVVYLRNVENFGTFITVEAEEARIQMLSKLNRHIQKRILQGAE